MIRLTAAALMLMALPASAGEYAKFVVCPPHLSYCYYEAKPVFPQKRAEDEFAEIEARVHQRRDQLQWEEKVWLHRMMQLGR